MKEKKLITIIIALLFLPGIFTKSKSQVLFDELDKNVIAIEQRTKTKSNTTTNILATGFLINVEGYTFLVSAGHAIQDMFAGGQRIYLRSYSKKSINAPVFLEKSLWSLRTSCGFVYPIPHEGYKIDTTDHGIDIGCIYYPTSSDEDLVSINENLWAKDDEIVLGKETFLLGYPFDHKGIQRKPVVGWGRVINKDEKSIFEVNTKTHCGDSGGPVFLKLCSHKMKGVSINSNYTSQIKLAGVMSISNDTTTWIVSIERLRELIEQPRFKVLIAKLKKNDLK